MTWAWYILIQTFTAHRRWQVFRGDSSDSKDLIFSAKKSSLIQFKTELDVFLAANTKEDVPDFKLKGSWLERSCTIFAGNSSTVIAQVNVVLKITITPNYTRVEQESEILTDFILQGVGPSKLWICELEELYVGNSMKIERNRRSFNSDPADWKDGGLGICHFWQASSVQFVLIVRCTLIILGLHMTVWYIHQDV